MHTWVMRLAIESVLLIVIMLAIGRMLMALVDDLKAAVDRNTAAVQALIAKVGTPGVDPVAVQAAVDQINANSAAAEAAANQ